MQLTTVESATLAIGCELSGPADGHPVILLHGWPDDIRTWDRILPALHGARFKTIVPYLRGFGATRFRFPETARSGQFSALGQDLLDLADGLGLEHFAVVGHDWGARAAYIASCIAPGRRVTHCVAISVGWGTNDPNQKLSLRQTQNYWYHWYMALDRGAELVRNDRLNFTRYIWTIWNPNWRISEEEFGVTAASFENPDWPEVTLHLYRVRWRLASGDPVYDVVEAALVTSPIIAVPTLVIHGGGDPCNDPSSSEGKEDFFAGQYQRVVLDRVGHFPQREAPEAVSEATVRFLTNHSK
ncbi:MAG TPA: alpha/beta hydrolase [Chthoniobacterales bacterium]|nr:alpha/beta hydrolase [Chthoniobacterales bacterium]